MVLYVPKGIYVPNIPIVAMVIGLDDYAEYLERRLKLIRKDSSKQSEKRFLKRVLRHVNTYMAAIDFDDDGYSCVCKECISKESYDEETTETAAVE